MKNTSDLEMNLKPLFHLLLSKLGFI